MTPKFSLDKGTYKVLYERYREYLVPFVAIFVCLVLILKIVIPQVQDFIATLNQAKEMQKEILVLKNNVQFLTSLSDSKLDSQMRIASSALPAEKDFAGILNAITAASARAGVSLGDFSFAVGELSTKSAQIAGQPSIQVALTVSGDAFLAQRFIQELSKTVPLSEVLNVAISGRSSALTTVFYYKVFPPIQFVATKPIFALSQSEEQLLNKLSSWR